VTLNSNTAVDAVIDRLVVLEPLSLAQAYSGTVGAYKQWLYNSPSFPYWTNRVRSVREESAQHQTQLNALARLNLAHTAGANRIMDGTEDVQELAWQFVPEVIAYFAAIRTTLAPAGYAAIANIGRPHGVGVTCPAGLDYALNPYTGAEALYIDFEITVPISIQL